MNYKFKPKVAWEIIKQNTERALQTTSIWCSLVEDAPNKLLVLTDNHLHITPLNVEENQKLTQRIETKFSEKLLSADGTMKHWTIIPLSIVKEIVFLYFHEQLRCSENWTFN